MAGLISVMPLTMANGLAKDFERLKRFRTMLTTTVANIAPLQGEYNGGPIPHLLLLGRRGQPFFWSPFENSAGNHNVDVFGKYGSGKSVALQAITSALVGEVGRAWWRERGWQNGYFTGGGEYYKKKNTQ